MRRRRPLFTTAATGALAALSAAMVLATTSACTTAGASQTGSNGYVSGDGTIRLIDPAQRSAAPTLTGQKLGGGTLDTAHYAGKTLVLNVWGSWCGECRGEAPGLAAAARARPQVAFVGLDTRDLNSLAQSYVHRFDIPYPSLVDQDSRLLLEFYKVVSPHAIPSTLVIDTKGRLAAVINGATSKDTLLALIDDVAQSR